MSRSLKALLYDWETAVVLRRQLHDVRFYTRVSEGRVLELGCGTGRVTEALVTAGLDVTGLDLDDGMVEAARHRLGDRARIVQGDMRAFEVDAPVDTVLLPYNTFTLLTSRADQDAALSSVHRALVPGGLFAFEITPFLLRDVPCDWTHFGTAPLAPSSAIIVSAWERVTAEPALQRNRYDTRYELFDGGQRRVIETTMTLRTVFRYEMEMLLAHHGFEVVRIDGDYDGTALEDCPDQGMVFTTRRT